jgi:hypothetical protein
MWFILGFTYDAVVGAWQDSRLATECARVRKEAGSPKGFELLQGPGDKEHVVLWYVSELAARELDEREVDWRRFLIGLTPAAPPQAHAVLR